MKKSYSFWATSFCLMMSVPTFADDVTLPETVGSEDNTTAWWSAFSSYFTIEKGQALTLTFANNGEASRANYQNYLVAVTTDADRDADGYSEYYVVRADNYGWASLYANSIRTSNFDWDNFIADLTGATIKAKINYSTDGYVGVYIEYEGASTSKNYAYSYSAQDAISDDKIRTFLTVDGSHLVITKAEYSTADAAIIETTHSGAYTVGEDDNTTAWWTAFSDVYTIEPGEQIDATFVNYSSKAESWNNFLMVFANGYAANRAGYTEYAVIRADNFGWGNDYSKFTLSQDYDWTNFKEKMDGATVNLNVKYTEDKILSFTAKITTSDSEEFTYSGTTTALEYDKIGMFLTVEFAHIDISSVAISEIGTATAIDNVTNESAEIVGVSYYDLTGKQVGETATGLLVRVRIFSDGSKQVDKVLK